MSGATKIGKGKYLYQGYEIRHGSYWYIFKDGMEYFNGGVESKKAAMDHIDDLVEHSIKSKRSLMTDAELIAIDGGWAWLDQKDHIHEEVQV